MVKKQPLEHENLDLKNNLLQSARTMWSSGDFEKQLASLIIYTSFAEYLAEFMLRSVRYAVERASYHTYGGIVHSLSEPSNSKSSQRPLNMSDYVSRLEGYSFPDKDNILPLLKNIAKARNDLFHNFARIKPSEGSRLDKYSSDIHDDTEDLIDRVNVVAESIRALTSIDMTRKEMPNEN